VEEALQSPAPPGFLEYNPPSPAEPSADETAPPVTAGVERSRAAEPGATYLAPPERSASDGRSSPTRPAEDLGEGASAESDQRSIASPGPAIDERQSVIPNTEAPPFRLLAQAGERYVVVEASDGLLLVDQHALHERWNYERLRDREHPLVSQRLLMPEVVELSPAEAAWLDTALPVLAECGFEAERFGDHSVAISASPEIVKPGNVEKIVRDVFGDLEQAQGAVESLRDELIKSLACRSAVLFGTGLPRQALLSLLEKFHESKHPLTCPHGRPTVVSITWEELERRFGRR
jgi:DNA mismatch repair protein MutL